jgi:hypothetical protein
MKLNAIVGCFPLNSAAQQWYDSSSGRTSMLDYADFKRKFTARFGATSADEAKYQHDFFHVRQSRKESVGSYYTRYLQLLAEMAAIQKPVDSATQISRFIDGLVQPIRVEVSRIHCRSPTMKLDDVVSEAEMEEQAHPQSKPPAMPSVNGLQGKTPSGKQVPKRPRCYYCKGDKGKTRTAENCPEIAKRKANGTWVDRPRNRAGESS